VGLLPHQQPVHHAPHSGGLEARADMQQHSSSSNPLTGHELRLTVLTTLVLG